MRPIALPEKFLRGLLDRALAKRYDATLDEFLFAIENRDLKRFPKSDDLVDLAKRLL